MASTESSTHDEVAEGQAAAQTKPTLAALAFAAVIALVAAVGTYGAGLLLVDNYPVWARVALALITALQGISATVTCLTLMVVFTEGRAATTFTDFFDKVQAEKDSLSVRWRSVPVMAMAAALYGFGSSIVGALGEDWSDEAALPFQWLYFAVGLFGALFFALWLARRLERAG